MKPRPMLGQTMKKLLSRHHVQKDISIHEIYTIETQSGISTHPLLTKKALSNSQRITLREITKMAAQHPNGRLRPTTADAIENI